MKKRVQRVPMISQCRLLGERRWTKSLIRRFAATPDKTTVNMNYRSGPPMKLFIVERIEAIESTPEFRAEFDKA